MGEIFEQIEAHDISNFSGFFLVSQIFLKF